MNYSSPISSASNFLSNFLSLKNFNIVFVLLSIGMLLSGYIFGVNYPWNNDDAVICLKDYLLYENGEISLLEYLTKFKNGHTTFMERLYSFLSKVITGYVNFKVISLLSNFSIIIFTYYLTTKISDILLKFITAFILLSFTAQLLVWASGGVVYIYTFIFAYLSWDIICREKFYLLPLLLITFLLTILSFSNGLLIIPLTGIFLITQISKSNLVLRIGQLSTLFLSALIHWKFVSSISLYGKKGTSLQSLLDIMPEVIEYVTFAFIFSGNIMSSIFIFGNKPILPAFILGILLFILLLISTLLSRKKTCNDTLWLILGWISIGSAFMASIGRYTHENYILALSPRYEIFSAILLLCLIHLFYYRTTYWSDKVKIFLIAITIIIFPAKSLINYIRLPGVNQSYTDRMIESYSKDSKTAIEKNMQGVYIIVHEAIEKGIFKIDKEGKRILAQNNIPIKEY